MESVSSPAGFSPETPLPEGVTAELESLRGRLAERDAELAREREGRRNDAIKMQALTLELAHYRRIHFGRKSEALSPDQRLLFDEAWSTDTAAIEAELETLAPATRKPRARPGRQPLPEHLPRIEHRHEPESCTCGTCGAGLVKIGEDISEQLDVEPSNFFVHRHIRPQYACRACETVTAAPIPACVIDGGVAAPGLLAWVLVSKFVDHQPLYRIEKIAAREQVPLARSTLSEWVGRCGFALQPLADRLAEMLRHRPMLHADETPVKQLAPGYGKTRHAYLWAYRSNSLDPDPPIIVFDYQPGRSGQYARDFLDGWRGHLMVDDYGGYKKMMGDGIIELACLVHLRRRFAALYDANGSPAAQEALRRIAELYEVETLGRGLDPGERLALRQREAKPRLEALHAWLQETRLTAPNGGALAAAIDHMLGRWTVCVRPHHVVFEGRSRHTCTYVECETTVCGNATPGCAA
jgi:transposase